MKTKLLLFAVIIFGTSCQKEAIIPEIKGVEVTYTFQSEAVPYVAYYRESENTFTQRVTRDKVFEVKGYLKFEEASSAKLESETSIPSGKVQIKYKGRVLATSNQVQLRGYVYYIEVLKMFTYSDLK